MLEFIILTIILLFAVFMYATGYPLMRKYSQYKRERRQLEENYTRTFNARHDMLVHYDWALSRQDPPATIAQMGREIERMEGDLRALEREIELLERNRWTIVPM